MTTVLVLVSSTQHPHDYGVDNLVVGLHDLLRAGQVYDWPPKPCLHLPSLAARDACAIDSDACLPTQEFMLADVVHQCDFVLIAIQPPDDTKEVLRNACRTIPSSVPIAAYDPGDDHLNWRKLYEGIAGRPLAAFFKRELPLGADWALPLPLSYPDSKVPKRMPDKALRVCYHATDHGGGAPGIPRRHIAQLLRQQVPPEQLDIELTPSQQNRLSPEAYHERLASALIGINWNGAAHTGSNRFWENFAFATAQVSEMPRELILYQPEHELDCLYADSPEGVVEQVKWLLRHEDVAREMAHAGHQHFLRYHSSRQRARHLIETMWRA